MTPGSQRVTWKTRRSGRRAPKLGLITPCAPVVGWRPLVRRVRMSKGGSPKPIEFWSMPFFQGVVAWEVSLFFTEENSLVGTCRRHNIDNYCRVGLSFQAVDLDPLPGEHPGYMLGMSFWKQERRDIQEGGPSFPQSCHKGVLGQSSQGRLAGSHRSKNYTFTDLPQFSSQVTPNLCTAR